jgi:type VI secretion system secreted protein VgrG
MPDETRIFHFHSEAVGDDTFQLSGMKGVEEISTPYEFEIDLLSKKADVPLDKMLTSQAWIAIRQSVPVSGGKRGTRIYKIHGILSGFEVLEQVHEWVRYRAILVPRLWKCTLTTQSRVFQDVDIKDMIKQVLTDKEGPGLSSQDLDLKLNSSYTKREFVVQYNETDLDFLHRWMEHEGIYYFFDQTESGEKIVFADGTAGYAKLPGDPKIPYRPDPATRSRASGATAEETLQEESVHSFRCRMKKTPKEVVLKDYNYRTPSVEIKGKADVKNPAGEGKLYVFGEHFKTSGEGNSIAKVRAEEIQCRDKTFDGTGDHRSFRPGTVFNLSEHYRPDFNASYVLTRVRHALTQGTSASRGTGGNMTYLNEFDCIPSDDVFRPERRTPWPSIFGFLNAKVDAGGSGDYAEIDDQGRYKVKLPFDMSDKKDGKASRFIRMAQPYAGANMGMHFPLHKNTEVLLSFVDGDVDRPIIASAVPNAESAPPVTSGNQSQCAIHTGGGNKIVIEDTAGNERIKMSTPHSKTVFQLGAPNTPGTGAVLTTDATVQITSAQQFIRKSLGDSVDTTETNRFSYTNGKNYNYVKGLTESYNDADSVTVTKGNTKARTEGSSESVTIGDSKTNVTGNTDDTFTGSKTAKTNSTETSYTYGKKASFSLSTESEMKAGLMSSICAAAKLESTNGISTVISKAAKITLCDATEMTKTATKEEVVTGAYTIKCSKFGLDGLNEVEIDAGTKIHLKCGGSEITMTPSEIVIKSSAIKVDASGAADFKSGATATVKGSSITMDGPVNEK